MSRKIKKFPYGCPFTDFSKRHDFPEILSYQHKKFKTEGSSKMVTKMLCLLLTTYGNRPRLLLAYLFTFKMRISHRVAMKIKWNNVYKGITIKLAHGRQVLNKCSKNNIQKDLYQKHHWKFTSVPWSPRRKEGLGIESITSGQWFNQSYLCNGTTVKKPLKKGVWRTSRLVNTSTDQAGGGGQLLGFSPPGLHLIYFFIWLFFCFPYNILYNKLVNIFSEFCDPL